MTYGRLNELFVLQLHGSKEMFNAHLETPRYRKMMYWRTLLVQYLLQRLTGADKPVSDRKEQKRCGDMPLLTDLALVMPVDLLFLIFSLREFVTVVYGLVMTGAHVFPDGKVKT